MLPAFKSFYFVVRITHRKSGCGCWVCTHAQDAGDCEAGVVHLSALDGRNIISMKCGCVVRGCVIQQMISRRYLLMAQR